MISDEALRQYAATDPAPRCPACGSNHRDVFGRVGPKASPTVIYDQELGIGSCGHAWHGPFVHPADAHLAPARGDLVSALLACREALRGLLRNAAESMDERDEVLSARALLPEHSKDSR